MSAEQKNSIHSTPRWLKLLLLVTTVVIMLRLIGVIHVPAHWMISASVLEVLIALVEITLFGIAFKHFYIQHSRTSANKFEAIARSQADELRVSDVPAWIVNLLEKEFLLEAKIFNKIFLLSQHAFKLIFRR